MQEQVLCGTDLWTAHGQAWVCRTPAVPHKIFAEEAWRSRSFRRAALDGAKYMYAMRDCRAEGGVVFSWVLEKEKKKKKRLRRE